MAIKHYFGYYLVNGTVCSQKWIEDDGMCIGGKPDFILQRHELKDHDIHCVLSGLAFKYPYRELPQLQ